MLQIIHVFFLKWNKRWMVAVFSEFNGSLTFFMSTDGSTTKPEIMVSRHVAEARVFYFVICITFFVQMRLSLISAQNTDMGQ